MPELVLDYVIPTDVYGDDAFTNEIEPFVPFPLGVRITNGSGTAKSLKIESAQPKIVENELGLLIGFEIQGSQVNCQPASPKPACRFRRHCTQHLRNRQLDHDLLPVRQICGIHG
ncbi:hypothetical protein QUF70_16995 [Desulfobacterales bacterium HSG17]|nr:hypothetical protein [Desulfobacterales bacterium HSG17]